MKQTTKLERWQKTSRWFPYAGWLALVAGLVLFVLPTSRQVVSPVSPLPAETTTPPSATPQPTATGCVLSGSAGGTRCDVASLASTHLELPLFASPALATPQPTETQTATTTPFPPQPTPTPCFVLHRIRPGETLTAIAAAYGVTSEALLIANDIRDPTNLPAGQSLIIPPRDGPRVRIVLHQVAPKDTWLSIAMKYGSSVKDMLAINSDLWPDTPPPVGQTVGVPVVFNQAKPTPPVEGEAEPVMYTVEAGDVPLTIADEYDLPVELLLAANEITDPTRLQVGQQLVIPPADGLTMGVPIILYEVASGDTLLGIATKYGSSAKDILAVNPDLAPSALRVGQTIAIPIIFDLPKPTPQPVAAKPRAPVTASEPLVAMQQQMIDLVNAERQAAGLPPYQQDEQMMQLAVDHAQDMVVRGYFSHVTPEGQTLRDRFQAHGLNGIYRVGEDIQRNTRPAGETVQTALTWFMGSRPHRNNILHHFHNRIGVGIVEGPPGWYTFVLVFAQK